MKKWQLLQLLNRFCVEFRDTIEGARGANITKKELHGGARIRYVFDEVYRKHLNKIDPTEGLTLEDYRTAIRNAAVCFPPLKSIKIKIKATKMEG